jgi:S-adenosylmethionine synthetase
MEFVDRKGIGHPDSICDAIMENVSIALCSEYLAAFWQNPSLQRGQRIADR